MEVQRIGRTCKARVSVSIILSSLAAVMAFAENPSNEARVPLPLFFFPGAALSGEATPYVVRGPHFQAVFASRSAVFALPGETVRLDFAGATSGPPVGEEPLAAYVNFLEGNDPRQWRRNVTAFQRIGCRELYPGIDLAYIAAGQSIKSEFTVKPGADPRVIRIVYSTGLRIDQNGDLVAGPLREHAPVIFQETTKGRVVIPGEYRLLDAKTAGFAIGAYDPSLPLVIDPVISYSTYLGGSGMSAVTGVALDSGGNLYATGWTEALNFPIIGPMQAANQGGVDAFVVKMNPAGTALVYATYIGGRGDDRGAAIAVDSSGQAHVTGSTASQNFPLASPVRSTLGGSKTVFVLKLNSAGNSLIYSTYLGGTAYEVGTAIALDSGGNAYVAGDTQSANFPVLNAARYTLAGGMDAFVTKLTPAGALSFSTYLGGSGNEHAGAIAVDSSGRVYVAGGTSSANFPVVTAIQPANGGNQDAFVTRLSATGSQIQYSTYLGGNGAGVEQANAIAVDGTGNAYAAGTTPSTNFPVTGSAFQPLYKGASDAFVVKINNTGTTLGYSTYLGGTGFDWAAGIRIDSSGNAYVAGYTSSVDFPQSGSVQSNFGGMYDAFVTKLNAQGNGISFSTYFGAAGSDTANALATDANGNIFLGGQTSSVDFPLAGPIQSSNTGGNTGWLARIGVTAPPAQMPSTVSVAPSAGSGNVAAFTAQFSDTGGGAALTTVSLLLNSTASTDFACYVSYNPSTNLFSLANDVASSGSLTVSPGGGAQQNSQCTLNGVGTAASISGATLTITVSLIFQPGFAGAKTVYLYAADAGANTGWVARGSWTVTIPPPQPSADAVSPNANAGPGQTFTFYFSDTQSATNFTAVALLFAPSLTFTNACYMVYDRTAAKLSLLWDNAQGGDIRFATSTTVLQNSQCSVGAFSATLSGLTLIVSANVTFKGVFSGVKNIYMYGAESGANTGWVQRGTYSVTAGGVPVANSVIPGSGSGSGQRFSFTISDQGGANYLKGMAALIAPAFNTANACYLVWDSTTGTVSLAYDTPANGSASVVPGSSAVVSNSQCTLRAANSTVVVGTTSVVVTLDLVFAATWYGPKNIYLYASEVGANSGWVTVGGWTVTGGAPTADSVTPSSGAGNFPTFAFTVSDSSSQANITGIGALFTTGPPTSTANACYLVYNRTNATIGLYDNAGTTLSTKPLGSSATLQNSQCAIGYTVMTISGTSVTLSAQVLFYPANFGGTKTTYLEALEPSVTSGMVARGSWTVQ
jgi:hypothetical protein